MNERTARWLAPAAAVLAADVVLLVVLGPLVTGVIEYRVSSLLRHQLMGADLVSLTVLAPLTLLAAWLVRHRYSAGALLALGTALTTWYLAAELVLGPDRTGPTGNDEAFLPLFLGVLLLATAVAIGAWRALPGGSVTFDRRTRVVVGGGLLVIVALLVLGRYVPAWLSVVGGAPPADYLSDPGVWWTVTFENLALLLPAAVAAGVGLLRGACWAGMAAFAAAGCLGLVGLTGIGMAWSTTLHGDPGATPASAWAMTGVALAAALPGMLCWIAVIRTGRQNLPDVEPTASATRDGLVIPLAEFEALGALSSLTAPSDTSRLRTPQTPATRPDTVLPGRR